MATRTTTSFLMDLHNPQNEAAWRRFYARYTPMLLSYARRVGLSDADAQDVVADTLATFIQAYWAGRYRRDKGRLKSWLGGIARNKALKRLTRRTHASLSAGDPGDDSRPLEPAAPDDRDEAFEREWQLERLNQALEILRLESDPNTYQAFDLYALKDWPVAKVASFLDMTTNAVFICKHRCLKRLRRIVENLDREEE